jgi:hypothetical protein
MKVFIMRGVPGCGKSKWCKDYHNQMEPGTYPYYASADLYMVDEAGKYEFKPERLPEVHDRCLRGYSDVVEANSYDVAFVDNTNLRIWEIAPYYRLAEAYGHEVEIVQFTTHPEVAAARNTHGVPYWKVIEMYKGMDPLPFWWMVRYV